jgi:integrase
MAYAEKVYKVRNGRQTKQFTWRSRYKRPDGTWGSEPGFPTKKLAEDWGNTQESAIRAGIWIDPAKAQTNFGEWVEIWKTAHHPRPGTATKRRHLLDKILLPAFEFTPLVEVNNVFTVKAWATKAAKPVGPHDAVTVGHARSLLSSILTGAEDAGYIAANKLYGRKIAITSHSPASAEEEVWAQPDEANSLYRRLAGVHGLMVLTDCYLGLRWGELTGLHRDNCLLKRVDRVGGRQFTRHVVRIDPLVGALHEDEFELDEDGLTAWHAAEDDRLEACREKGWKATRRKVPKAIVKLYLGPPKNEYSAREIDVPPFLVKLFAAHIESWPYDHPFTTPSGDWWRRGNFGRVLRPAADGRKAIPRKRGYAGREAWAPILPGFTMRGARHTHDTWMKEDRVDRALRFATMGWVPKDIEGVYEHVTPEMRRHRLDCLEERWRRGQASEPGG